MIYQALKLLSYAIRLKGSKASSDVLATVNIERCRFMSNNHEAMREIRGEMDILVLERLYLRSLLLSGGSYDETDDVERVSSTMLLCKT